MLVQLSVIQIAFYNRPQSTWFSGDYEGDSYQNSIGDVLCAVTGYYICVGFVALDAPYAPAIWFIISELLLLFFIRDSLLLIIFQLVFRDESIKAWQKELIERREKARREQDSVSDDETMMNPS